jgi:FkbM family methyltransferase
MSQRLQVIRDAGVEVGTVLDVGVQASTDFLIERFPEAPHLLFDAIDDYFGTVRQRYANLSFELVHLALSDVDGQAWQVGESRDGSNRVTHSFLSDHEVAVGSRPAVRECKPIAKARLDTVLAGRSLQAPYLLKLDVDGHETAILRGATETLQSTSIVIVEASVATISEKLRMLEAAGFALVDIVDPCYYHRILSQVDLLFVHKNWTQRCEDMRPWQTKSFTWDAWFKFV